MRFEIDPSHSSVSFSVRHLGIASVRGHFNRFSGWIELDEQNLAASHAAVTIEAASVDTRQEQRDNHLRSPDFLDVATYPTIAFRSTLVHLDGNRGHVHGDLTIHGVTRPVVLEVEFHGAATDPFEATTKLNRKDFGLRYNSVLESGGLVVGEEVKVSLEVEAVARAPVAVA